VPSYLSDAWIAAMDTAVRNHAGLKDATRDVAFAVQQTVTRGPDSSVSYVVSLRHGTNRVTAGPDPAADVTFSCDQDTATAIARGRVSAQEAFLAGRLRIGGDTRALMRHQPLLAEIDDVFAGVRADTDFGPVAPVVPVVPVVPVGTTGIGTGT
jgi:putative sterol carrier protein